MKGAGENQLGFTLENVILLKAGVQDIITLILSPEWKLYVSFGDFAEPSDKTAATHLGSLCILQ